MKWPVTADNQHFKQFEQYLLKKELNDKLKLNGSILECPSIHFFDTFLGSRKMADLLTALISRNLWDHFLEKKILKINMWRDGKVIKVDSELDKSICDVTGLLPKQELAFSGDHKSKVSLCLGSLEAEIIVLNEHQYDLRVIDQIPSHYLQRKTILKNQFSLDSSSHFPTPNEFQVISVSINSLSDA